MEIEGAIVSLYCALVPSLFRSRPSCFPRVFFSTVSLCELVVKSRVLADFIETAVTGFAFPCCFLHLTSPGFLLTFPELPRVVVRSSFSMSLSNLQCIYCCVRFCRICTFCISFGSFGGMMGCVILSYFYFIREEDVSGRGGGGGQLGGTYKQ